MAKRLRVRDKLLFAVAIFGDLYFEVAEPVSAQLGKMKGVLPPDYKSTDFTGAVSRMLRTGYIEKIVRNGESYLRLTNTAKNKLTRDFSFFSWRQKKWDGLWRIVFYDVPEENKSAREKLQAKLCELGFGMAKESTYITPYDVAEDLREFLVEQKLGEFVFVCVAKQLFTGGTKTLVTKIWQLDRLQKKYLELLEKIKNKESADKIFAEYETILRDDPCLPRDLLPEDWVGEKVYREVRSSLRKS